MSAGCECGSSALPVLMYPKVHSAPVLEYPHIVRCASIFDSAER